jgi:hypothetical protein
MWRARDAQVPATWAMPGICNAALFLAPTIEIRRFELVVDGGITVKST